MKKKQKSVSIKKDSNGSVVVYGENYRIMVDLRSKTPQEKLEAVRWAILLGGYVYTEKVERMVRRELGI